MIIASEQDLQYDFVGQIIIQEGDKVKLRSPTGQEAIIPIRAITAVYVEEDIREGLAAYKVTWEQKVKASYGNYSWKERRTLYLTEASYRLLEKLGIRIVRRPALTGSTLQFWAEYGLSIACRFAGISRDELVRRHTYHKNKPALQDGNRVFVPDPEHPEGGWWEEEKNHEQRGSAVQTG